MTNPKVDIFLKTIMKNQFKQDENEQFIKYSNDKYEIIQSKKNNNKMLQCIVTDKIGHIVYNDINIAFENLISSNKL